MELYVKYNPYSVATEVICDGEAINFDKALNYMRAISISHPSHCNSWHRE